jgi:hypothetical protein
MTDAHEPLALSLPEPDNRYVAGACNIGPAEIARRRRAGHAGLAVTIGALAIALAVDAPPAARLLVGLPAAAAASGYLQAHLRFCAGFGSRGVFNFGPLGERLGVADPASLRKDRVRAGQIGLASAAVGAAVGIAAALLPR